MHTYVFIMFQGQYAGTEGNNTGGIRYHQGRITRVYKGAMGEQLYDGMHTKGENDGKWVTYRQYSYEFKGLMRKDLRVSPNIFDILNAQSSPVHMGSGEETGHMEVTEDDDESEDEYDVFISYSKLNSDLALDNDEVAAEGIGKSIAEQKALNSQSCDPRWIKKQLVKKGLRVSMDESRNPVELNDVVSRIKKCKVVIPCISNEYAKSDTNRMELQFSKKTMKKAILPIVVGGGEWKWQATVVGLLIAGELYINFTVRSSLYYMLSDLKTIRNED